MEVHLLPAISADDFPIEEVYERCPDFLGFLHTRLASLRSRLEDVLHLLEVFTGNKRFVRVPVSYTHLDVYKRQASALPAAWHVSS